MLTLMWTSLLRGAPVREYLRVKINIEAKYLFDFLRPRDISY